MLLNRGLAANLFHVTKYFHCWRASSENGFRDSFAKYLKGVKDKGLLNRVRDIIKVVEEANLLEELPNLKKLKGAGNYFRVRIGDYRIGIALENDTVIFVRFLNRRDIYKYFP